MLESGRQYDDWKYAGEERPDGRRPLSSGFDPSVGGGMSAFTFLCVVVALTGVGLVMMYSASYDEALSHGLPHHYYFLRQAMFIVLAAICSVIIRFMPMKWIRKCSPLLLAVCLLLMLMTLYTPFGQTRMGARRWLSIGPLPSFQPSELVKLSLILFLASWFSSEKHEQAKLRRFFVPALVVLLFAALILLQRDYSTTIVYLCVCLSLFVVGGISFGWMSLFIAFLAVPAVFVLFLAPYRVKRLAAFFFSDMDTAGINWQVTNARKAIAAGGWTGVGLGNGVYKLGLIPEVQSDFIFASIAEETGFFGILLIFILFFLFALLGYRTWLRMMDRDRFLAYTAFGITTMIIGQALVNVAVVTGVLPPTGIPLPFFSQGGTNLFVVLCECALLYRIMLIAGGRLEPDRLLRGRRKKVRKVEAEPAAVNVSREVDEFYFPEGSSRHDG
ncbi:MAG: putative peptidoglycan glycosyltransferase FtsW [Sphaerochaetaceae bacterium]|nr:putative peptidoglycan glycosyltransferase FtsW [Sphaerochaetaceae bacterium]